MALENLDLEFEDENELEAKDKKKNGAVDVGIDLEFQAPEGAPKPRPQPPRNPMPAAAPVGPNPVITKPAEVRNIQEGRAPRPPVKSEVALGSESQQIAELREKLRRVEQETDVKLAVAEFKTNYLTEMLSDMKLVEHQIGQILTRVNARHPDTRNEMLLIKKILADFLIKKRK